MIATGLSASDREDPQQQERDYLFKRILLWEVVTFVILLFSSEEKSIKKVAEDTCDCVLGLPQRFKCRE